MKTLDNDRVIIGGNIQGLDFIRFQSMGVTPYYYDSKVNWGCSLIEVTRKNISSTECKRVFLLTPKEYGTITEFIESVNSLIVLNQKKIELLKDMVIPILVDKIMK